MLRRGAVTATLEQAGITTVMVEDGDGVLGNARSDNRIIGISGIGEARAGDGRQQHGRGKDTEFHGFPFHLAGIIAEQVGDIKHV